MFGSRQDKTIIRSRTSTILNRDVDVLLNTSERVPHCAEGCLATYIDK